MQLLLGLVVGKAKGAIFNKRRAVVLIDIMLVNVQICTGAQGVCKEYSMVVDGGE